MTSSTLLFEAGIMKISDYDPIHGRYQTRTLQLPKLPLFDDFDLPSFDSTNKTQGNLSSMLIPPPPTLTTPINIDHQERRGKSSRQQTMSRFVECFEFVPETSSSPVSTKFSSSSTLRSTKSIPSKKTGKLFNSTKTPRRCYSNPNFSKKSTLEIEPLDPALVAATFKTSQATFSPNAPKRSLSNAFHALTGRLPKSNKRRVDNISTSTEHAYGDIDADRLSCKSVSSSSSTIRQAWQGNTWLDEMKTSCDFGSRPRLSSIDQTGPWWNSTPLSNSDVCVKN